MEEKRQIRLVRNRPLRAAMIVVACTAIANVFCLALTREQQERGVISEVKLPPPVKQGAVSVEEALAKRRSVRSFRNQPLTLAETGQLLWAGQGVTDLVKGLRTSPSAGQRFPIELYTVASDGVFHYLPRGHCIEKLQRGDLRSRLADLSVGQPCVRDAAIDIVIVAVFERTTTGYGERGRRYVILEAGHVAQNILLQARARNLSAVAVGAFQDEMVRELLELPEDHEPLYILSIGRTR